MQAYHEGSTGPDDHDDDSSPPKDDKVKAESRKGIINRVNRALYDSELNCANEETLTCASHLLALKQEPA